jgi:malonyl CoA-acyl carrier protein transacylase
VDNFRSRIEKLTPKRLALLALELQSRVDDLERQRTEPIAIIGMGCRIPGAEPGLDGFWRLLEEGRDVITEVPADRWDAAAYYDPDPDVPGRMSTKFGGFLNDVAGFDASFFGISRREAMSMDPQQRILLEVCWEALEHAGYCPRKAAGGSVGVFAGITTTDYHSLMLERGEESISVHTATGSGNSIAAGRISYVLGLEGPSISLDTACSSSLVALHLACQSLRLEECRIALAGGVNALLAPELFIALSKAHALAPDGRCKAFDSRADGFGRAEGCGVVVLKRLSRALADGDHILALIRGSALSQDGRSSGMTAPNGAAQEAVIRQALTNAGIAPEEIDYAEAHGTGTRLGDPIEAHALAVVLGPNRTPDRPLLIGSVKTNLGHLEAASGVVGLIKIALALQHGVIPRQLHFQSLNPHIDWKGMPLEIAAQAIPWRVSGKRRIAGLNSFGLSGTNAHAIIEEPPAREKYVTTFERPLHLLTLSARSDSALEALSRRFSEEMARTQAGLGDICYTASVGRAHFERRAAYIARTPDSMRDALAGVPAAIGSPSGAPQVVFLFPGQGAQYSGMARQLYDTQPVFREALDECARLLEGQLAAPLSEVLWGGARQLIDQTAYTQPALFAVEYALAQLWMSWGVEPVAVLGHSVGEYVAACVAGVFSLEDGLRLIAERARLMQNASGEGAMAAVMADEARVRRALAGFEDRVTIAALNAPASVVISGYRAELDRVQQALEQDGIEVRRLAVSHAFHSPQMREMQATFEQVAATVRFHSPRLRLISSATGRAIGNEMSDPGYWRRQVSQPVRFRQAVETLDQSGYRIFLEVGPGTTLAALGRQCIQENGTVWLPSIRRSRDEWAQMLETLAQLYVSGVDLDWAGFDKPYSRTRVPLPTYPFEREHFWFEDQSRSARVPGQKARTDENIDGWFYKLVWEAKEPLPSAADAHARWLVVPDQSGVAAEFAKTLEERRAKVVFASTPESLASHLRSGEFDFVLHAAALDHVNPTELNSQAAAAGDSALIGAIATAQALIAGQNRARLWLLTCGAQPVLSDGGDLNLIQAPLWGLGRTFALEHPDSWGGLVDLDPAMTPAETAAMLFPAIMRSDGEDQAAFRGGRRHVARLVRHQASEFSRTSLAADKTYLITGGAGGLGLELCTWLAEHGALNLLLLGRRAPSEDAALALAALRKRGVGVEFRIADVTRKPQLDAVFAELGSEMPPLAGVVHAAGVLDDSVIANLTPERLAKVLAPKVDGAWNLHQLTAGQPLGFFIMFSSLAAVTGSPGQAAYAAANCFQDGLAYYRRARGLPAVAVNWGGWAGAGMAARVAAGGRVYHDFDSEIRPRAGAFRLMRPESALSAFGRLLSGAPPQIAVAEVDWDQLEGSTGGRHASPIFSSMLRTAARPKAHFDGLRSLAPEALRPSLISYLKAALAPILGIKPTDISPGRPIVDCGLDSLMALEFRNRISADLRVTVPTAHLLQGPSLEALADEIATQLSKPAAPSSAANHAPAIEYPLSFGQQMQWFGHKLIPGSSTFNVGFTASLSPCLDWSAFGRAASRLVERHPALRTAIVETESGNPVQRVAPSAAPDLALIAASDWPEEELKQRVIEEFSRAFEIDCPMVRIRVYRSEHRDVILFAADHLILDAFSLQICLEDLKEFYSAEYAMAAPQLSPLSADYGDFVKWEATLTEGPESERLWSYWKEKLRGDLPVLNLPSSHPRPDVLLPKGQTVRLSFGADLSAGVQRIARGNRTTSYAVLLAAYYVLLKMYCRQDDIIVGTSVSRRDDSRWSRMVGLFLNVLPLRVDLSGNPKFTDHLAHVRKTLLGALEHNEFPFPAIVSRLMLPRTMQHGPVFQAFLNFLQDPSGDMAGLMTPDGDIALHFGGSVLRPFIVIPQDDGQSEIALRLGQNEDQLVGDLNYNADILDRVTAEAMAESYLGILENAVREPDRPITELIPGAGQDGAEREEIFL